MKDVDLNLLKALDILLEEASVTVAARRLRLSTSAMSRTLTRLREATGDPLLVRAGRKLVPTPHAAMLRDRVRAVTGEACAVLQPSSDDLDPTSLDSTFTIRASSSFMEMLSAAVVDAISREAPRVHLRFESKLDADGLRLRHGHVDLEIGKASPTAPEIRTQILFHDRYVGVARVGHPLLSGKITLKRYAACKQVVAAQMQGYTDSAQVVVPGFPEAMRIAGHSDLIAIIPQSSLGNRFVRNPAAALGLRSFELPVSPPDLAIAASWHPRVDADAAHRWLRETVISVCRRAYP